MKLTEEMIVEDLRNAVAELVEEWLITDKCLPHLYWAQQRCYFEEKALQITQLCEDKMEVNIGNKYNGLIDEKYLSIVSGIKSQTFPTQEKLKLLEVIGEIYFNMPAETLKDVEFRWYYDNNFCPKMVLQLQKSFGPTTIRECTIHIKIPHAHENESGWYQVYFDYHRGDTTKVKSGYQSQQECFANTQEYDEFMSEIEEELSSFCFGALRDFLEGKNNNHEYACY